MAVIIGLVLLIGSLLSFWATSLVVRALVERAEIRARKKKQKATALATPQTVVQDATDATASAPPPGGAFKAPQGLGVMNVNPLRNVLVFALSPLVFLGGLATCWVALGVGREGDLLPSIRGFGSMIILTVLAQVQIAAALVCVGWWFDPSRGRRRCPRCWYDMGGTKARLCTECGFEARSQKQLYRTRRKFGLVWIAVFVILTTYLTFRLPRAAKNGLFSFVPTTLLVMTYEYWPVDLIASGAPTSSSASLEQRIDDRDCFEWQTYLMVWHAGRVLASSKDPVTLLLSLKMLGAYGERSEGYMFTPSDETMRELMALIGSDDAKVRVAAAEVLQHVRNFNAGDPGRTLSAREMQTQERWNGYAMEVAEKVVPSLSDQNWEVCQAAAQILSRSEHGLDNHLDDILAAIQSDTSPRRTGTFMRVFALALVSRSSERARAAFLSCLEIPDPTIHLAVARSIDTYLDAHPEDWGYFEGLLRTPPAPVAGMAARMLAGHSNDRDAFAREVLSQAKMRPGSEASFITAITEAMIRAKSDRLPAWVLDEYARILADTHEALTLRMEIARNISAEYGITQGVVDGMKVLAGEKSLTPLEQEELDSSIVRLQDAMQAANASEAPEPEETPAENAPAEASGVRSSPQ